MYPPGDAAMPQRRRMMGAGPGGAGPLAGPRPPMRPPGMMGRGPMPGMGAPQGLGGGVPRMPMQAPPQGPMQGPNPNQVDPIALEAVRGRRPPALY
jgi:hypothetical protein